MFGSSFDQNFGIPAFPFENVDSQGGMFAQNTGPAQTIGEGGTGSPPAAPNAGPGLTLPGGFGNAPSAPATGVSSGSAAAPALGASSPLGGGVLAPGSMPPGPQPGIGGGESAPAAGLGSPFGKQVL